MLTTVLTALIAVVGTLAGGGLNGYTVFRTARAQRLETHKRELEKEVRKAVVELVAALDRHRGVMWEAEKRRLAGITNEVDTSETRASRAEVSAPATDLCLIADDLAQAVREAESCTYAMRESPTRKELDNRREMARAATRRLVDLAAAKFKAAGIGITLPAMPDLPALPDQP